MCRAFLFYNTNMGIEVEIKAWVDSFDTVKESLNKQYKYIKEYEKDDLYFRGTDFVSKEEKEVRIRRVDGSSLVTYKERSHRDKVEVNIEKEFKVDNYDNFKYLVEELGYKPYVSKNKSGFLFKKDDINIELSHVLDLGDFIEIEAILTNDEHIDEATKSIYSILDSLDIPRDKVEDRFYVEMLLAKNI